MGPALLAAGLVAYNTLANRWRPFQGWAYVPMNLALAAAVVALGALAFDLGRGAMGLRWADAWVGAAIAAAVMAPAFGVLVSERGRARLRDERLAGARGATAAFMVLVRIPVGTALVEEVVFRGVMIGAWLGEGEGQAVVASSVAFGLWHVGPTLNLARMNRLRGALIVPAGVVLTAAGGAFLGWLRLETGGVAAPLLLHALVNSLAATASLAAWRAARRPDA